MIGSFFRKIYTGGAVSKRDAQKFYSALPVIYKSKYKEEKWCVKKRKKNEVWTCESFFVSLSLCLTKDFLKSPSEKILTI